MKLSGQAALALGCGILLSGTVLAAAPAKHWGGPGSVAGIWVKESERNGDRSGPEKPDPLVLYDADGQQVPTRPEITAIVSKRLKDAAEGRPFASTKAICLPEGVPDMIIGPGPTEILETPGQITMLREVLTYFRIVRMNAKHLDEIDLPGFNGDGVGRWEGDTLVIDTIGTTDRTSIMGVIPHSEDLHVVERLHRTGPETMDVSITIEDPKTFTRPWTIRNKLKLLHDRITEYFCENNRNPADANGNLTTRLQGNP